jgi:hypothetical protein
MNKQISLKSSNLIESLILATVKMQSKRKCSTW